jgi:nicotinate dehydrogenase subunit B
MTGLMHEKDFSRRSFLKGGGAMVIGFSIAGAGLAGKAAAATSPAGYLPDLNQLDSWITINADNTIVLKTSKVELGQGISTGFLQVLAEEMDTDMSQMIYGFYNHGRQEVVDNWVVANTGGEGGSNAMSGTGPLVRQAGALAKQTLLGLASTKLGVPVGSLSVDKGVVSGGGKSVTYGELVGGKLLNVSGAGKPLNPGVAPAKPIEQYKTVTKRDMVARIDIPDKVTGKMVYVHNIRVPGMVHGRLVRPRGQGAYPYNSNVPISIDEKSIAHIAGAQVVRVGNFVGVVAPKEYDAIQAAAQLKVVWNTNPILPGNGNMWKHYKDLDAAGQIPAKISANVGNVDAALASAAHVVSGTFAHHYQGHMPIGPCCAVADVQADHATIWSSTQNVPSLTIDLVNVLAPLPEKQIHILYYEGSGSFGNGAPMFDTAQSAAIMSKAIGKPVRLQFMRWEEHGWTHYAPSALIDMRAGVDSAGNIVAYELTQYNQGGGGIYTARELLGGASGAPSPTANTIPTSIAGGSAGSENASPWMKVSKTNYKLISKPISSAQGMFQSGPLRAPGAQQTTLADAQTMDMLAVAANMDSLAFRVQNHNTDLDGQRWVAVLQAAAAAANWKPWVSGSSLGKGNIVTGRGIAQSHHGGAYAAVVMDIEVNKKTGKILVKHVYGAQDAGLTVNPNLVENQMMGSMIQGVSRALFEELAFNKNQVTSLDWVSYPIMRFKDAPAITSVIVQRTDQPCLGSGEPTTCPIVGAMANAFYDATGVRLHEAPFTAGRVRATLKAAGVS